MKNDVIAEKSKIQGVWNSEFEADGKKLYTLDSPLPHQLEYEKHPLASDANFREDIINWKLKDIKAA